MENSNNLKVEYVDINILKPSEYNPRKWDQSAIKNLTESIKKYGIVDPVIANKAKNRFGVLVGGHFRYRICKDLGIKIIPVIWLDIPDIEREKSLNLTLNKVTGDWDWDLLKSFDESFLNDVGFSSEELDDIFNIETPEVFDLEKELKKLQISKINTKPGDVYQLGTSRLMCGDSTSKEDFPVLMNGEKADMCFTDEPYILNYLKGKKKHSEITEGFGLKRNRIYLGTESLPDNFMELWMSNVSRFQKENFSIISFENWKNLKDMWETMQKYWLIRNVIIWHCPNRTQGFAAKYKLFSKYDIAVLGTSGKVELNDQPEDRLLQNEYETAIYATSGKPNWEGYKKGKKICPTDFVEFKTDDEKSSGQGIIFGCKPVEILVPYIKVLTHRNDLVVEPFGGSGSTLIAAVKLKRRCFVMEKSPVYTEVIKKRWENFTKQKAVKVNS